MSSDPSPTIGFISGSLREGSINKQLENAFIKRFERAGATCATINLGEYDLPLFHGDLDAPTGLAALIKDMNGCDGLVVISPEYNGGLPPVLKNAIDWISTADTTPFRERYWGISSCTPGPMSGIMCMRQINYILMRLGAHVSPFQVGVGNAADAFDADGELVAGCPATLPDKMVADMLMHV